MSSVFSPFWLTVSGLEGGPPPCLEGVDDRVRGSWPPGWLTWYPQPPGLRRVPLVDEIEDQRGAAADVRMRSTAGGTATPEADAGHAHAPRRRSAGADLRQG